MHKLSTFINPEDGDILSMVEGELNEVHGILIGVHFDIVGYPKRWLLVSSTMVRAEVIFWQETFLKNLNSI